MAVILPEGEDVNEWLSVNSEFTTMLGRADRRVIGVSMLRTASMSTLPPALSATRSRGSILNLHRSRGLLQSDQHAIWRDYGILQQGGVSCDVGGAEVSWRLAARTAKRGLSRRSSDTNITGKTE